MVELNYHMTAIKLNVHSKLSMYSTPGKPFYRQWLTLADFFIEVVYSNTLTVPKSRLVCNEYGYIPRRSQLCFVVWENDFCSTMYFPLELDIQLLSIKFILPRIILRWILDVL